MDRCSPGGGPRPWIGKKFRLGQRLKVPVPGSKNSMQSEDGKEVKRGTLSFGINGEKAIIVAENKGKVFQKREKPKDFRCHKDIKQHKE